MLEQMTPQAAMTVFLVAFALFGVGMLQNARSVEKSARVARERADEERDKRLKLADELVETKNLVKDLEANQRRGMRERETQQAEIDALRAAQEAARVEAERKDKEHERAVAAMARELAELGATVERITRERDTAIARGDGLQQRIEKLETKWQGEREGLEAKNTALQTQVDNLSAEVDRLKAKYESGQDAQHIER